MEYIINLLKLAHNNYCTVVLVGGILIYFIYVLVFSRILKKAGIKPYKALIPVYNLYISFNICNISFVWYILQLTCLFASLKYVVLMLPTIIITIILHVYFLSKLAKVFGKGFFFTIGLILLPPIFILILAFDKSKYVGLSANKNEMNLTETNYHRIQEVKNTNNIICPNCKVNLSANTKTCIRCGYKISD